MRLLIALFFAAAATAAAAPTASTAEAAVTAAQAAAQVQVPRLERRQTASGDNADKAVAEVDNRKAHHARRLDEWMAWLELALLGGSGLALATNAHVERRRDFFSSSRGGGGHFAWTSLSQGSPFRLPPDGGAGDEPLHSDVLQLSAEEQRAFGELQRVERRMREESLDHYLAYIECAREKGDIFGLPLVFRLSLKRQCLEERLADGLRLAPEPQGAGAGAGLAGNAPGESLPHTNGAAAEVRQQQEEEEEEKEDGGPPSSGPMAVIRSSLSGAGHKMREAAAAYVKKPIPPDLALRGRRRSRGHRSVGVGSSSGLLRFVRPPLMPVARFR